MVLWAALMRALLGLIKPSAGAVPVFGKPPRRGAADIGYVPQVRTAVSELRMRGMDVVGGSLHGERWGLPILARKDCCLIEDALTAVGVRELADRPLSELSGGERQRLLLAQALMGSPRLLLLDEPLISLDPRQQEVVIEQVRRFGRQRGITLLFSAHEVNQLLGVVDRVLYLGGGHAALGTVDEVVTGPVLSRLYGSEIRVVRAEGNIFVMANGRNIERSDHLHEEHQAHCADEHEHPGNVRI